jgi:hypothetical protein
MTEEKYQEIKEYYKEHLIDLISETGGLYPHLTIFADIKNPSKEDKDKPAIIHLPIPDKYMKDDDTKDEFVDEVLPDIAKKVKEEFIPQGVAWASEAWMRVVEKDEEMPKNWKKLPIKKEIVIVTIETDSKEEADIYEIKREGKQVTSDGNLVDKITLEKFEESSPSSIGGRFSGLFKNFKD